MLVYRIANRKFAGDISGTGAAIFPGRWNKRGMPVLYTGESREIALLETLVNLPLGIAPPMDILTLEIPDGSVTVFEPDALPANWADFPAPSILAEMAHSWIGAQSSIALRVPSAVIPQAYNVILNCTHPDYGRVKVVEREGFQLDPRLVGGR